MGKKNNKKDKNPKSNQQTSDNKPQQQGHSVQSQQHQSGPSQPQSSTAARGQVPNLRPLSLQIDEGKSSRSEEKRSEEHPNERGAKPKRPEQRSDARPPHQHQGAGQYNRKPQARNVGEQRSEYQQPWRQDHGPERSQGFQHREHMPRQQYDRNQRDNLSERPRNDKPRGEFSRAGTSEWKKPQAAPKDGAKTQQKRPPPITNENLKKQGIKELEIKYKSPGISGQSLGKIETNFVRLKINKIPEYIYHYDVSIEPDRPKKFIRKVFEIFAKTNFAEQDVFIAFDGAKNAYASQKLKTANLNHDVQIFHPVSGKELNFKVINFQEAENSQIQFRQALTSYKDPEGIDPKRALQALENILKAAFSEVQRGLFAGRSFFVPPVMLSTLRGKDLYLGNGSQLWLGLFQSVVAGDELFLNIDVSHKAFPKRYDSLFDLLEDIKKDMRLTYRIDKNRPLDRKILDGVNRALSGLDVCYTQPGVGTKSVRKFVDIDEKPSNVYFNHGGARMNVLTYFTQRGTQIQYPEMPCLKIGSRKSASIPMEFCSLFDAQVSNKKNSDIQTRNIIRFSATSTDERKKRIMDVTSQVKHNESATIQGFGIEVQDKFIEIGSTDSIGSARKLDPPTLQYKNSTIVPTNGEWNPPNMKFLMTQPAPKSGVQWGLLNADWSTNRGAIIHMFKKIQEFSMSTGVNLATRPLYDGTVIFEEGIFDNQLAMRIRKEFENIGKESKIEILFIVIPNSGQIYGKIKKMAEVDHGILTQCVKGKTVNDRGGDPSTISNIMLKINTKLNGTNHKLETCPILTGAKCMFIGADVTHPSPDQNWIPRVICPLLQRQYKEMILDFKTITLEHLKKYKKENGVLPEKIFYYRDGVSESQFDQVMAIETDAMIKACKEIKPGYENDVKITVIVVQKRHHTRFFPGKTGVGVTKFNNVPAGTIVDSVITPPGKNQFLLASHQAQQGTTKPTKYCVLLDQGEHTMDELEILTNNLCHVFARCNRTVSYPAPTYYAHHAASRGCMYIKEERFDMNELQEKWESLALKDNIVNGRPMFFI